MKKTLIFLLGFTSYLSLSQTTEITKILQNTIQQENEARKTVYTEIDSLGNEIGLLKQASDSLEVTEAFIIKNDTLHYTVKKQFSMEKGYYLDQQKVALSDIIAITKDIGIFFETQPDKVFISRKEYFDEGSSNKQIITSDLFRTHFVSLRDNEYLADNLVRAFKKAGYKIEKGQWYD